MSKSNIHESSILDLEAIMVRIRHFCAYQERCSHEVDQKLMQWKVSQAKTRQIMRQLKEEGFIDEERYARIFVRSKFHINKWGRIKIRYELKGRNISENLVNKAMEEIGEDDYMRTIHELVLKKKLEINSEKHLNIREKILTFVTGKGFEFDLIIKVLTELKI
ncbi:MAG: regulatory protein RecX [Bacteroidales bacterium]|nr:regulatory protein RecX [Bacteroidales bacterium]